MLDFGFYNMDCMEGMRQFPDKYFDLAIVDPPYGDGNILNEGGYWNRFGQRFDRYKKTLPKQECPATRRNMGCGELAEEHRNMGQQKNHFVGCCAGAGIL